MQEASTNENHMMQGNKIPGPSSSTQTFNQEPTEAVFVSLEDEDNP